MNNLPAKRHDISPFIRGNDIDIVQAYYGCALKKLSKDEAIKKIVQVLNKAFVELGLKATGNTREEKKKYMLMTASLICNDANLYFPNLTLEELQLAVARGIRNEYGEYFGLNVIAVHKFIDGFLESESRKTALERQRRFVESQKPKPEPTPEEIAKIMEKGFEDCKNEYDQTRIVRDWGNVNYDYAVEKGWINLTIDEKWELYHQAEKIVQMEIRQQATTIHQMISSLNPGQEDNSWRVAIKAKNLALKRYFDSLKQQQK